MKTSGTASGAVKRTVLLKKSTGDKLFSIALMLPTIVMTFAFILIPVIDSILKSFLNYKVKNIISGQPGEWNNFANYIKLFQNNKLLPSIVITFTFVVFVVALQFIFGMTMALILNSNIKCARFLRSIMMTPWVVPTIISALIWMWIFQPQYGLMKYIISFFTAGQISDLAMLNNPNLALLGISVAALWKQIPLTTLLLLAGLQNVPDDMLEAATVDGANNATKFFRIIIPYMKSVIKVAMSMAIIENFKQFPLVWTMTGGGPNNSTTTLAILSYREAFVSNNLGSGAAVTTVWMLLMIVVILIYNRIMRSEDMD
ncbi:carbohydrate ABC transporter membrane protein 1 (CUT1 family) [Hydrogenoanaerobacterium saccharovorans]|uniref:Carbohydrate ABC transporter membrane protein 1, CUT1 family n=1 Tax=Hydrogenoanaerobacterium saccharovorans TaxID=474960 RepID=A0A1H7YTP1_9FIRM|nr:sugar ABC transporter permease [Hydrogenoanaerobacterium saccharovorans]RPF49028.1 carbohydrate ABC transporter membrane protein 1 (CUT1 family) [Hydrogenoanaerobacterium saccharovorans]SEM49271.1 carbohydrate ABC transporter membrane protein 1, CUT1 family [Hydrogenoanaerobacterium saccharovorans]